MALQPRLCLGLFSLAGRELKLVEMRRGCVLPPMIHYVTKFWFAWLRA
jgi:hypothetical protein